MTPQRLNRLTNVLNHRQPDLTVVLENVFDPHNVSAVMRTCDAVGIQDVYILNNRIPPHKKWGYRSSSTANKWLNVHQYTDAESCFTEIRKKYKNIYTTHLADDSVEVYDLNLTESIALVFGNETFGVSEEIRNIPTEILLFRRLALLNLSTFLWPAPSLSMKHSGKKRRKAITWNHVCPKLNLLR